ncbi:uncharacterized protein LOC134813937 isoform X2 [Bolinopsis microptera]|uniref:uncharacterized protein LOC134813937 isoform X2 n=1 Tax=Bolinopsis microptera TaxID=2820187 RepID=UPI003079F82A
MVAEECVKTSRLRPQTNPLWRQLSIDGQNHREVQVNLIIDQFKNGCNLKSKGSPTRKQPAETPKSKSDLMCRKLRDKLYMVHLQNEKMKPERKFYLIAQEVGRKRQRPISCTTTTSTLNRLNSASSSSTSSQRHYPSNGMTWRQLSLNRKKMMKRIPSNSCSPINSDEYVRPTVTAKNRTAWTTPATRPASTTPATRPASTTPATRTASTTPATRTASTTPATRTASTTPATRTAWTTPATRTASTTPATRPASTTPADLGTGSREPNSSSTTRGRTSKNASITASKNASRNASMKTDTNISAKTGTKGGRIISARSGTKERCPSSERSKLESVSSNHSKQRNKTENSSFLSRSHQTSISTTLGYDIPRLGYDIPFVPKLPKKKKKKVKKRPSISDSKDEESKKTGNRTAWQLWTRTTTKIVTTQRISKLFRENSRSAESAYRKRGLRNRFKTEHGSELDDEDYVAPINRFRKVARLVQLALIFYSGEGKTSRRKETEKAAEEHHAFFDKSDKMTFLPAFDPSLYKAQRIKELIVGSDIKEILGKRPEDRTEEEIQQVLFALRTYETFAEYPLNMQERMCRKAHYLKFDTSRIILRQGDRAEWFYYVLSGTTAVSILEENKTTGSVNLRNVGYLKRGTAFGELALLHGTRRTATVSCKDAVELIAVDKEDFVQMNQLDSDEEKEHIRYCRTLPILNEWPVNLLNEATGVCNFHFFKKGTVMAKSNHDTPFIYIVKSGHVRVLTKVTKIRQKQVQGCRVRSRTASSRTPGSGLRSNRSDTSSTCSNGFRSRISSQSTNGVPPTHGSSRHMKGNLVPLISRLNVGEGTFQDVPIQPTFLQVCVLGAGDSFGLSTLVYSEEISCGIVSLGAECIEISKEFFLKNATENYLRKLKATIRPFPSEDKLQQDIQDQKLWNNYKNTVVASVLDPSSI